MILGVGGGGLKCLASLGALNYLREKTQVLENLSEIRAGSGGSIVGFIFLCLYHKNLYLNIENYFDKNKIFNVDLLNFKTKMAIINPDGYRNLLKELLQEIIKKEDVTFIELYEMTNITFSVFAFSLDSQKTKKFNHLETPHVSVTDAAIASCSIPLIFPYVTINNENFVDPGIEYQQSMPINSNLDIFIKATYPKNDKPYKNSFVDYLLYIIRFTWKLHDDDYGDCKVYTMIPGCHIIEDNINSEFVKKIMTYGYDRMEQLVNNKI